MHVLNYVHIIANAFKIEALLLKYKQQYSSLLVMKRQEIPNHGDKWVIRNG